MDSSLLGSGFVAKPTVDILSEQPKTLKSLLLAEPYLKLKN